TRAGAGKSTAPRQRRAPAAAPVACTRYRYGLGRLYGTDGDNATVRLGDSSSPRSPHSTSSLMKSSIEGDTLPSKPMKNPILQAGLAALLALSLSASLYG